MKTTILRAAVVSALAALALSACHREAGDQTVGQRIDNAIDRTQQKLADAGDKTQQKLAEVGDKTQQKLAEAGTQIAQTTGHAMPRKVHNVVKIAVVKPRNSAAGTAFNFKRI